MNNKPLESVDTPRQRVRVAITGAVQGVGFRPFVYRLATDLGLTGWVGNSSQGVVIEAEGAAASLEQFLLRLSRERPPRSFIQSLEPTMLDPVGFARFDIRPSLDAGTPSALVVPDIAVCDDCLHELFDPADRRYGYPFITCTNCGPRFSIVEALPYDRPNTTMKAFAMCDECRREYEDPGDRRFHAQPNACPRCGPQLALWTPDGQVLAERDAALRSAAQAIREGRIVAIKGLGGFHLVVDARSEAAVARLRARKVREEKPLALMYPALDEVRADCEVSPLEERLLLSPEAPIVLLRADNDLLAAAAQAYLVRGLFDNALGVIDRRLKLVPDDPAWLYSKGYVSIQLKNYDAAIAALSRVLAVQTNNDSALFNRAIANLDSDRLDAARADYLRLQRSFSNSLQVAYGLGEIAWRQHDTNEAVRNYRIYLANADTNGGEAKTVLERLRELKK